MNKKLLLGTLIFSLSINVHSRDLPNADIDGSSDCENTFHASWQALRNANKKQPEPVTPQATTNQQKSIITEPVEPNPQQAETLQKVCRKPDTETLRAQLEAKKQELKDANQKRTTLSNQLLKINEFMGDLDNNKKSTVLNFLKNMGFGTAIAAVAECKVQKTNLSVPPGATFGALELIALVCTYHSSQRVKEHNQQLQSEIEQLVLSRHNTASLYANAVSESQRLQQEIARLEQELAQQN